MEDAKMLDPPYWSSKSYGVPSDRNEYVGVFEHFCIGIAVNKLTNGKIDKTRVIIYYLQ